MPTQHPIMPKRKTQAPTCHEFRPDSSRIDEPRYKERSVSTELKAQRSLRGEVLGSGEEFVGVYETNNSLGGYKSRQVGTHSRVNTFETCLRLKINDSNSTASVSMCTLTVFGIRIHVKISC